jgi:hypothetical protein
MHSDSPQSGTMLVLALMAVFCRVRELAAFCELRTIRSFPQQVFIGHAIPLRVDARKKT